MSGNLPTGQTLYDLLRISTDQQAQKPALVDGSTVVSYESLLSSAERLAAQLADLGVGSGQRVLIAMPNSAAFAAAYFGVFAAGAVAVPLSLYLKAKEMHVVAEHSQPAAVVLADEVQRRVEDALLPLSPKPALLRSCAPDGSAIRFELIARGRGRQDSFERPPERTALILYTSGTTGRPKGVVLSHQNIISNAIACAESLPVGDSDVFILFLPMFHSFGFTVCLVLPILLGATSVILSAIKRDLVAEAVESHRVTVFVGIPALYGLMARSDDAYASKFESVRFFISGAAPLAVPTIEASAQRFDAPLLEGYGLTEASPVVSLNPFDKERKAGSVGLPLPGVGVRVVNESGSDVPVGTIGELLVRGPNVMAGYWRDDAATAERIRDGWLYTGDMARLDEDGYIYIEDRKDDMILVQGANVYPSEVEGVIRGVTGVAEVAVVGVVDSHLGKRPVAVVQPVAGAALTEEMILAICRQHLADYKVPRQVIFWDQLPVSPIGKPLKRSILALLKPH